MVCDVKTISDDGAIVKRLGSRDVSIEQKKRPNNAGKRPKTIHVGPDNGGASVTSPYAGTDRDERCRKTAIDNTRSRRQDLIGREGYTTGIVC